MVGYQLMTEEQRQEWDNLEERRTHSDTMRFSALDAVHLGEYEALAVRIEAEREAERFSEAEQQQGPELSFSGEHE